VDVRRLVAVLPNDDVVALDERRGPLGARRPLVEALGELADADQLGEAERVAARELPADEILEARRGPAHHQRLALALPDVAQDLEPRVALARLDRGRALPGRNDRFAAAHGPRAYSIDQPACFSTSLPSRGTAASTFFFAVPRSRSYV